jgi:hypothetical protein
MTMNVNRRELRISVAPKNEEGFSAKYLRFVKGFEEKPVTVDEPFRGDPMVVLTNVRRGLHALRPHMLALRADTSVDWDDVFMAEDIAEALVYGCDQVVEVKVTREDIEKVRRNLQKLREPALFIARGLALLGELPLESVEQIEEGVGIVDTGRDGLAIPALFRAHASTLANKHPFTEKHFDTMESLGAWILRHVTPDGAEPAKSVEPTTAELRRDMLWADLRRRHAVMRLGGFKMYGETFNDFVPPLGSRLVVRKADVSPVVPKTEPTPNTAPVADKS